MGSCFNKKAYESVSRLQFLNNQQVMLQPHINISIRPTKPLHTTLYYQLRKSSNLQIIHQSSKSQTFRNSTKPNVNQMSNSQLKILYNFKNVLIIGKIDPYIKIPHQVNLRNLFIITYEQSSIFNERFPVFGFEGFNSIINRNGKNKTKSQLATVINTPLLIFCEEQLTSKRFIPLEKARKIYIHLIKYRNDNLYNLLRITAIIEPPTSLSKSQKVSYYLKELTKPYSCAILLHDQNFDQNNLRQLLTSHFIEVYHVSQYGASTYLKRFLPGKNNQPSRNLINNLSPIIQQKSLESSKQPPSQLFPKSNQHSKSNQSPYVVLLNQLKTQASQQIVERVYSVCCLLLTNIYSNPDKDQNFRKVKISNPNIQNITKYKNGRLLLQELGWNKQNQNWVNNVDAKYLKMFRIQLQVAYKYYRQGFNNL